MIRTVFTYLFISMLGVSYSVREKGEPCTKDVITKIVEVPINTCNLYDESIKFLKEHEGFRSNVYYDTDGSLTIGYGHQLIGNEKSLYKNKNISEEKATEILKRDLDKNIKFVRNNTNLTEDNKILALGLLSFNVGQGNLFKYITINKLLEKNNINNILKYCHYKTVKDNDTIIIRSERLYKRRKFELFLYNLNSMKITDDLKNEIERITKENIDDCSITEIRYIVEDYLDKCKIESRHSEEIDIYDNFQEAVTLYSLFMNEYTKILDNKSCECSL